MPTTDKRCQDRIESNIAAQLSGALITIAAIAFAVIGIIFNINHTQVSVSNQVRSLVIYGLLFIGVLSLFSAGLIIDSEVDKGGFDFRDRCNLAGNGYFLFCAILGIVTAGAMIAGATYAPPNQACIGFRGVMSAVTGLSIFSLLMTGPYSSHWAGLGGLSLLLFLTVPWLPQWFLILAFVIAAVVAELLAMRTRARLKRIRARENAPPP